MMNSVYCASIRSDLMELLLLWFRYLRITRRSGDIATITRYDYYSKNQTLGEIIVSDFQWLRGNFLDNHFDHRTIIKLP